MSDIVKLTTGHEPQPSDDSILSVDTGENLAMANNPMFDLLNQNAFVDDVLWEDDVGSEHANDPTNLNTYVFDLSDDDILNPDSSSSDEVDYDDEDLKPDLTESLAQWGSEYSISHSAINGLLKVLKPFHPQLPLTATSLFHTVKKSDIRAIPGGEYCHFGLADGIKQHMKSYGLPSESYIELQINIDGLPLFKSSQLQVWPILCCMCNSSTTKDPFVVGIFSGNGKPGNLEEFLRKFVDEVILLLENGICYCDRIYDVVLNCFVCDAPARAFIKNIKGHSGYYGCEKCIQEGEYHKKMTFPLTNALLRSDESFARMEQEEHHKGPSPLTALSMGMVSKFPLDYMHLVCLGVVKRFLTAWLRGPLKCRLSGLKLRAYLSV